MTDYEREAQAIAGPFLVSLPTMKAGANLTATIAAALTRVAAEARAAGAAEMQERAAQAARDRGMDIHGNGAWTGGWNCACADIETDIRALSTIPQEDAGG